VVFVDVIDDVFVGYGFEVFGLVECEILFLGVGDDGGG